MRVGLMQPYFFPYMGYFDLINRVDRWVVFDVAQYTPQSWMNRNRILHPSGGWQYLTVPIHKAHCGAAIEDVRLLDKEETRRKILRKIEHYRPGGAPYFAATQALVDEAFAQTVSDRLRDLNIAGLRVVCRYLGIPFEPIVLSESEIALPTVTHAGQWALEVTAALGGDIYVNLPGGRQIFSDDEFRARGVSLTFTKLVDYRYPCGSYEFVERLSIIDVLMWNGPEVVKAYLGDLRVAGEVAA